MPATNLSYFIHDFKILYENEDEMWNILLYTFRHIYEILNPNWVSVLIYTKLDKKPSAFHQKTIILSEMMWNMKYEKGTWWNVADILYTFTFSYFTVVSECLMISV